jgi:two-component system, chemotaxis family, protein-glutamate methylesterase/glutaminase
VGASVGGVQALAKLAANLSEDLPAAVAVVLHTASTGPGLMPQILQRSGKLPAAHAKDDEPLEPGRIYVAPADHHLVVDSNRLRLTRTPKVNGSRPAVDMLFESAAEAHGPRVIGILLTGSLSDGAAGLERIKQSGGITVVQDPTEAYCPEMPLNALRKSNIDFVLPIAEISALVNRLAIESAEQSPNRLVPQSEEKREMKREKISKEKMGLTCPECHGPIEEKKQGR